MFKSIFERLFWTNVAVLIAVLLSISVTLTFFITRYTMQQQYENILRASENIEYMTIAFQVENTSPTPPKFYRDNLRYWANFVKADILIINQWGNVFESTNGITQIPKEYATHILSGKIIKKQSTLDGVYEEKVFVVGIPILYDGTVIGGMIFNTEIPNLHKTVSDILTMFLISASSTIILAFVFIYFQSRKISRSIKSVNQAAMDIAAGHFDRRVTISSTDEIGQLASSFNFMADSLERLEEMRSSFVSDVSHELRTPMTSISGFIQGILDETIPEEKRSEYLQIVFDETNRLTRLVNNMLETSKISNLQYKPDIVSFNLTEMIRLAIIQLESKISSKDLEVNISFANDHLLVLADEDAIRRVILNLLENAVKFSYNNTEISIKVWIESNKVFTSIGNYGMGIDSSDLRNVFDRFYKTDKSRSNDKKGAGLGLYLVKNLLNCHNQDIWAESYETKTDPNIKYTTFTFSLEKA